MTSHHPLYLTTTYLQRYKSLLFTSYLAQFTHPLHVSFTRYMVAPDTHGAPRHRYVQNDATNRYWYTSRFTAYSSDTYIMDTLHATRYNSSNTYCITIRYTSDVTNYSRYKSPAVTLLPCACIHYMSPAKLNPLRRVRYTSPIITQTVINRYTITSVTRRPFTSPTLQSATLYPLRITLTRNTSLATTNPIQ